MKTHRTPLRAVLALSLALLASCSPFTAEGRAWDQRIREGEASLARRNAWLEAHGQPTYHARNPRTVVGILTAPRASYFGH